MPKLAVVDLQKMKQNGEKIFVAVCYDYQMARIAERGVLKGLTDKKDYPKMKTRIEGHFEEWLPALINADKTDHLRISGAGT